MPGPREAIEERRYAEADAQIALVAHSIDDEAGYIEHLASELEADYSSAAPSSSINGASQ
jgi:hypothetical protein